MVEIVHWKERKKRERGDETKRKEDDEALQMWRHYIYEPERYARVDGDLRDRKRLQPRFFRIGTRHFVSP